MRPEQYTKADLLWIIKRMTEHSLDRLLLERALSDLEYEKEKARIAEAERLAKEADEKRQAYIEIMAPYDGMRLIDVPFSTVEKADKLMKEAQAAERKWAKLLGVNIQGGGPDV